MLNDEDCNSYEQADYCTSSKKKLERATHLWTIDNFNLFETEGSDVDSPVFSSSTNDEVKWFIRLKPNGKPNGEPECKDYIGLFLNLSESSEPKTVFARFSFTIFNKEQKTEVTKGDDVFRKFDASDSDDNWGWDNLYKKDAIFRKELLSNNVLKIYCEVIYFLEGECFVEHVQNRNTSYLKSTTSDYVTEDLGILLETHLLTDVVISGNGKEYQAHKTILAARSKVFAAMFQHDTKENQTNRIAIKDMSEEVIGEMLRFIYTGRCEKLDEFAVDLLAAADKYDLEQLKTISSEALCKNLSIENAAQILIAADMHNAIGLKKETMKFVVGKSTEVFVTADWKSVTMNPQLCEEVFRAMARR